MLNLVYILKRVRQLTNQRTQVQSQAFFNDSELKEILSGVWRRFYNKLVQARENYFIEETDFVLPEGADEYEAPQDFYKIKKLDLKISDNNYLTIKEIKLREENREDLGRYIGIPYEAQRYQDRRGYYLLNSHTVKIVPQDISQGTYRLKWVPKAPPIEIMNDEGTLVSNPNIKIPAGFDEWLIFKTAVLAGLPEEGDLKNLKEEFKEVEDEISQWMSDRSQDQTHKIAKVIDFFGQEEERSGYDYYDDHYY